MSNRFPDQLRIDSRSRSSRNDNRNSARNGHQQERQSNTVMSQIVTFFAAMNRPSKHQPVGQYKAHTTNEEMMGLL